MIVSMTSLDAAVRLRTFPSCSSPLRSSRATCRSCGTSSVPTSPTSSTRTPASRPKFRPKPARSPPTRCERHLEAGLQPAPPRPTNSCADDRVPRRRRARRRPTSAPARGARAGGHRPPRAAMARRRLRPGQPFSVAVIGAGMSGLAAAHRLRQAGIDVTVFEKNDDVGGTWFENTYPGCRVDVPNHLYSYSFAQTTRLAASSSRRRTACSTTSGWCADELGLREHIRFATGVESVDVRRRPPGVAARVRAGDGRETHEFNAVCSAVGQLNRPNLPDIPGRDTFTGPSFHSAEWDHDVDLAGKRVGGDRHGRERRAVHPGRRRARPASSSSSSARRRGSRRRRTTTTSCRTACAG